MTLIDEANIRPIDYLVIGNITQDLTDSGTRIGGTSTFSGLTAHNMGMKVGIVTSAGNLYGFEALDAVQVHLIKSQHSSTFKNVHTPQGRIQYLYQQAATLLLKDIPPLWLNTPIIHVGPIFNEVDWEILSSIPPERLFLTPQGWLRQVDDVGRVHAKPWHIAEEYISKAAAIVISNEDVNNDENLIDELARQCKVVVVTENQVGARVYWNGDLRRFSAPETTYIEDTGAGDIFAAAFFCRLYQTKDPWSAAQVAIKLSSASVERRHLQSIPTVNEVSNAVIEIIN